MAEEDKAVECGKREAPLSQTDCIAEGIVQRRF